MFSVSVVPINSTTMNLMKPTCIKDYTFPDFIIDTIELHLELDTSITIVTSQMKVRRNKNVPADRPLVLDGKNLELISAAINGQAPTIQDFIREMEEFSGRNLSLFSKWFTQVGHPVVKVSSMFDKKNQTYSLTFKQFLTSSIQKEKTQKKTRHFILQD